MPRKEDPRVKEIVESLLLIEGVQWCTYLRLCPIGAHHMVQPDYGDKDWETVGNLYEACVAEPKLRCRRHGEPLDRQIAPETRLSMLKRLHHLQPPPYNEPLCWGQALLMFGELEKEMEKEASRNAAFSTPSNGPRTPLSVSASGSGRSSSARASSTASLDGPFDGPPSSDDDADSSGLSMDGIGSDTVESTSGASASSAWGRRGRSATSAGSATSSRSERGAVGRPVNPTCEVTVYVYAPGGQKPLVIRAIGTPRDNVVEFVFGQRKIKEELGIHASSGPRPTYLYYNRTIGNWALYPKPHQPLFLAPGERVLYREEYVFNLPNLAFYVAQLLPATRTQALQPGPVPAMYASRAALSRNSKRGAFVSPSVGGSTRRILSSPQVKKHEANVPTSQGDVKGKRRAHSTSPQRPRVRRKTVPRPDSPNAIDLSSDEGSKDASREPRGFADAPSDQHVVPGPKASQRQTKRTDTETRATAAGGTVTGQGTADDMFVIDF
ncbi:hypothetical protein OH77DRAFT_1460993 [Trametes cingulata]|nr:hypothetical protein OH77DRAFT_1460993 [Trametes cingulata]